MTGNLRYGYQAHSDVGLLLPLRPLLFRCLRRVRFVLQYVVRISLTSSLRLFR